jgi:hypothetical protein
VAVTTAGHPSPWWPYILLFGLALLGGIGYVAWQPDSKPGESAEVAADTAPQAPDAAEAAEYFITEPAVLPSAGEAHEHPPGPVIADRWHQTSDGSRVPALMGMTHVGMSHRGYMERPVQDAPPLVKIGMLVACEPVDPASSGTELRAKFAAFLDSPAVRQLIRSVTNVEPGMSWRNLAGNGPRSLEAALTAGEDPLKGVPAASVLFQPPTPGDSLYGRNGRAATLLFYLEPRAANGQVPPASNLAAWLERFRQALAIPEAFADFLAKDLALATSDDPPAQLGIWLQSNQTLATMIDTQGLQTLPGSWSSNQFIGWALAAPDGAPANETARDLIVQLCEYTLHLDAYEHVLAELDI